MSQRNFNTLYPSWVVKDTHAFDPPVRKPPPQFLVCHRASYQQMCHIVT